MSSLSGKPILILDVGSTSARAFIIETQHFNIVEYDKYEINLIQTNDGYCEINPEELFNNILRILQNVIRKAGLVAENILCLGLSVQRATFIIVDKVTGEPLVQLISWNDRRANKSVERINRSLFLKLINSAAIFLYWVTHKNIFKQGTNLKITNVFVAPRLSHLLKNNRKLKEAMNKSRAALFTVDTWLLNKLKNFGTQTNIECISDISNTSATGLFDAFNLEYNSLNLKLFGIKPSVLSTPVPNSHEFGFTHASLFGAPVRIGAIVADQAASLIGNACFRKMDAKITLGTGSFLNVNTGGKCRGSRNGAVPMIAWSVQSREKEEKMLSTVYYTERAFHESSTLIRFAKAIGLCSNESELSYLALSVPDSGGVTFIPKFYSLAGFAGYKQSTKRSHLVRAILESIVFSVSQFVFLMQEENRDYHPEKIRIDGGISANDFICQSIADLLKVSIERGVNSSEITSIGCAYLSAHNCGLFERLEHAEKFYKIEKVFAPNENNHRELFERFKRFIDIYERTKYFP